MSRITIHIESPVSDDGRKLIDGSEIALREVFTEDECFTFTAEELDRPGTSFFVARQNGEAMGCVAMVNCGDYAEIKRLFVPAKARGLGLAKALMAHLEAAASSAGYKAVRLETGPQLVAAVALYRSLGYQLRGRFGDYDDHPSSLFMEKHL